jgi:hypothetical protein
MSENNENFSLENNNKTESAITVEQSRAIQEVQGAIIMAKKFPRNETACFAKIIESCKRKSLAESAMYSYPRGKEKVTGASIRLAETLAKYWGNLQFGIVELSQANGSSEVLAYAWDLETNTRQIKQFTVKHSRYSKKDGLTKLTDPRDIYEMTANQGARRLRACILGVLPSDLLDSAIDECEKTLHGNNKEPLIDRVRACVAKFAEMGVTQEMIEKRFNHKIEAIDIHELVALRKIFNSLRDNMGRIEDYFEKPKNEIPEADEEDYNTLNEAQKQLFNKN